jgi:hypothetical protein
VHTLVYVFSRLKVLSADVGELSRGVDTD